MLDKEHNQEAAGPTLVAYMEPLAHRQNMASIRLLHGHYFGRCSSEIALLDYFPYSHGRLSRYSYNLHDLDVMSTVSSFAQLDSGTVCLQNFFL